MSNANLSIHHIHKLTYLATALDAQKRHSEADRLDQIVRLAQWWNPVRTVKNWQNADEINSNQSDPSDILHLIQLNLDKLYRNSQQQGWFTGLDPSVRATVISLMSECLEMFTDYADSYNREPPLAPLSFQSPKRVRLADLAGGLDRDIADILGLLSNLTNAQMFPTGDVLYASIQAKLKTVDDLLLGNITAQQAEAQQGMTSANPASPTASIPATLITQAQPQQFTQNTEVSSSPSTSSPYSYTGETYNSTQYLQRERVPGSAEWNNEIQNYIAWGTRNGGLQTLIVKMQQDQHTRQFQQAVQEAWSAQVFRNEPTSVNGTTGQMSASTAMPS